jgi:hypothetical protein
MTAIVTPDDVFETCPQAAALGECFIQSLINIVNKADACMAGAGYDADTCFTVKVLAVCHLTHGIQAGQFQAMTSPTRESVTFKQMDSSSGTGINSTPYGRMVSNLDHSGCISAVIENSSAERFITSVGC